MLVHWAYSGLRRVRSSERPLRPSTLTKGLLVALERRPCCWLAQCAQGRSAVVNHAGRKQCCMLLQLQLGLAAVLCAPNCAGWAGGLDVGNICCALQRQTFANTPSTLLPRIFSSAEVPWKFCCGERGLWDYTWESVNARFVGRRRQIGGTPWLCCRGPAATFKRPC